MNSRGITAAAKVDDCNLRGPVERDHVLLNPIADAPAIKQSSDVVKLDDWHHDVRPGGSIGCDTQLFFVATSVISRFLIICRFLQHTLNLLNAFNYTRRDGARQFARIEHPKRCGLLAE